MECGMLDLDGIQKLRKTVAAFHVDARALLARGRKTIRESRILLAEKPDRIARAPKRGDRA
jgi:hypothetical protein